MDIIEAIKAAVKRALGNGDWTGAPAEFVMPEDARGKELARVGFPALEAPQDLVPRRRL